MEQWRRKEEKRKAAQALQDSYEELLDVINRWAEATRMENFFKDLEQRANDLVGEEKAVIEERIRLARGMIDSVDALEHLRCWRSPEERMSKV